MLWLALSGGQGSTICVTMLVATALPLNRVMVSLRSRYSEQPPSAAKRAPSANVRSALLNGRIGTPLRHVKHVTGKRLIAGVSKAGCNGRKPACLFSRDLGFSKQKEIDVIRRQRVICRHFDLIPRPGRTDEMRRDNDGEVGFVLLIGLAGEQHTQNRHAAEPRQLINRVLIVGLQQSADDEALPIPQFNGCRSAADDQRRHGNAVAHRDSMRGIDLAYLGLDFHIDQATAEYRGRKCETDAVFFIVHGDIAERTSDRDWVFATRQEARGIAG